MYQEISKLDKSLRDYQQSAKEQIFSAWDKCDNVMFQMPTGTGKTRLFTSIISDIKTWSILNSKDVRILIIAHRIELIEQISESLNKYKVSHGIIAGGKERNLIPQVQVASIQTITHRMNLDVAKELSFEFVIIDEAHHTIANSYKKLWQLYPNSKKLGVTATPWRMNHQGFTSIFDTIILSHTIKQFIEEGWLAPYSYYSINATNETKREIDNIDEFDAEGDYKISALESVIDNAPVRAKLLDSYFKLAKGKKGIIYSISRRHSDHICEEFRNAGVNIVRIDSETSRNDRRLYVQRFRDGLIDIIVNVDIFSEGFDCPDIEFIQLARPTRSLVKFLQQVGRGLRPVKGKGKCIILDNVGSHLEFGLPDSDRDWNNYFIGEEVTHNFRSDNSGHNDTEHNGKGYNEGNDNLLLIEDINYNNNDGDVIDVWTDEDQELLELLVKQKDCSLDLIAAVFKKDVSIIQPHYEELKDSN